MFCLKTCSTNHLVGSFQNEILLHSTVNTLSLPEQIGHDTAHVGHASFAVDKIDAIVLTGSGSGFASLIDLAPRTHISNSQMQPSENYDCAGVGSCSNMFVSTTSATITRSSGYGSGGASLDRWRPLRSASCWRLPPLPPLVGANKGLITPREAAARVASSNKMAWATTIVACLSARAQTIDQRSARQTSAVMGKLSSMRWSK